MLFFLVKHDHALAAVSPFVEDPYDAVGSFAIQIALAAALVSLGRAILGRGAATVEVHELLVARGEAIIFFAIMVTAVADLVAMARHVAVWKNSGLARGVIIGLAAVVLLSAVSVIALVRRTKLATPRPTACALACAILLIVVGILSAYPDAWQGTLIATLCNAASGTFVVFLAVWALTRTLLPGRIVAHETLFAAVTSRLGLVGGLRAKRVWRCAVLVGVGAGLVLCVVEAVGEGLPATTMRAALLFAVIVSFEVAGALLGFVLFRRLLALL